MLWSCARCLESVPLPAPGAPRNWLVVLLPQVTMNTNQGRTQSQSCDGKPSSPPSISWRETSSRVGETLLPCLRQNGTASEALAQVGKTRVDHNCPTNNQQIKQASAPESTIYNVGRCPCTLVSIALRSAMDVGSFTSSMHPFNGLSVVALCGILAYLFLI
jgi:hypothetical protein